MKVFALPIKLVPINKSIGNETWQTTKNSLSDVQSASEKRLFSQPNLIVKTIPANSVNKSANNVFGNKTNATRTSNNKSKLPELSIVSVRSEQSTLDEQEDIHLLPSKIENKKSEIILLPLKRERKVCGHYEDCENITCEVTIQQYVENGRISPILAINIEENEINAPLGKHCENEKCDALNIDHNRCRRAAVILNRCNKFSECDICGVQLGWKSRLYHKNCKRKNEYRHNNINKMDLQRERMRERELQILEHAKFRKTDYSNPDKAMEVLQNNEELIIIPKIPVNHQYGQSSRQLTIPVTSVPIQSNVSNVQSVNISSIYEKTNLKNVTRSMSFSVIPQNTITMAAQNAITVTPQNTITVTPQNAITVNPQNTVMVKPQNTITVKTQNTITVNPQNTIMMKPQNAIMVKPHNTIISGTLLPIENNASSINQVRITNLQQQNYVTSNLSRIGTVTTVASVNTPIVTPVNSLSFVANVSTPGVASVTPSVVVVTTPITAPVNSVTVVAAPGSVATTATTIVTSTATTTLTIPAVPTLTSGAAPMVRIPIQPQNANVHQPVNNWIVAGSQVLSTPQVQHVYRLMPITNLITPPSLLHRTQGIPKFCIMTIPTTSSGVTAAAIVSTDAVVPPVTAVTTAAIVSSNAAVPPVTTATSAAIMSTNAIMSPATTASKVTSEAQDTQSKVKEEKKIKGVSMRLRSKPKDSASKDSVSSLKIKKKKGTLCTICKKFIKTDWYYKIHIDRHRTSNEMPDVNVRCYYCFICNIYFNTECDFMTHAFEKHNGRITNASKISNKVAITPFSDIKSRKRKLEDEKNCTTTDRDSNTDVKKRKPEDTRSSDPSENEEVNDELAQDNYEDEDNEDDDAESLESANVDEQTDQDPTTINDEDKEVDEFAFVTVKEEIDTIKSEIEDIADVSEDETYFTTSSDPLVTNTCTICRKYIDSSKTICLNCESANSEFSFESCL